MDGSPYRGIRVIGEGGMGVVVEAIHRELGTTVAVKLLRVELGADPGLMDRLRLEGQVQARLISPYLVRVTDAGVTSKGDPYIVMERLFGRSLGDEIRLRGARAPHVAVRYVCEALEGLALAHKAAIVHRDVKPQNLFLAERPGEERICKVLDFGVAKFLDVGREESGIRGPIQPTGDGVMVGSPRFMSPEQARAAQVDARSDIYSMGCVLFTALTGKDPFHDREGLFAFCSAHVNEPPPRPSDVLGYPVDPRLEAIIARAMAKDPRDRYQTAELFVAALRASQEDESATIRELEPSPDPSPPKGSGAFPDRSAEPQAVVPTRGAIEPIVAKTEALTTDDDDVATTGVDVAEAGPAPTMEMPMTAPPLRPIAREPARHRATPHGTLPASGTTFLLAFAVGLVVLGCLAAAALHFGGIW